MKKTALALTLVLTMILVGVQAVKVAEANMYPPSGVPALHVNSPQSNPCISAEPTVNISFDYYVLKSSTQVELFSFSLDESANSTLTSKMSDYTFTFDTDIYSDYSVSKTLENLANGDHSVTFYAQFFNGTVSGIWHLTIIVDTSYKNPVPLMISPINYTNYNTAEVPLVFAINTTHIGNCFYRLDSSGAQNSSWLGLVGNGTLSSLSEGSHTLELVVWIETQTETRYVANRETVYFNVNTDTSSEPATTSPSPEPTPTPPEGSSYSIPAIVVIGPVIAIAVGLGLLVLVYFKKRKH